MRMESLVVTALTLLISYFFRITGKRGSAVGTLPLVIVPVMNIAGSLLGTQLAKLTGAPFQWRLFFVVSGLLAQGAIIGAISRAIRTKSTRRTYLFVCGGFTVVFTFLIIQSILPAV